MRAPPAFTSNLAKGCMDAIGCIALLQKRIQPARGGHLLDPSLADISQADEKEHEAEASQRDET
jgi:hypothetical protein